MNLKKLPLFLSLVMVVSSLTNITFEKTANAEVTKKTVEVQPYFTIN